MSMADAPKDQSPQEHVVPQPWKERENFTFDLDDEMVDRLESLAERCQTQGVGILASADYHGQGQVNVPAAWLLQLIAGYRTPSPQPKNGGRSMSVEIVYFTDCGHSPAWPKIPAAMLELDKRGFGFQPSCAPVWNDPCLVALDAQGSVCGFLCYRYDQMKCSWFILLSYVEPASRRQNVHSQLFKSLVERAETRGDILAIECGTHIDNLPAQAAFEAQGRKRTAVMYEYRIAHWLEGKPHLDVPKSVEG
jgi:ribosomal protein S18 acetylase RimI-like enzyme